MRFGGAGTAPPSPHPGRVTVLCRTRAGRKVAPELRWSLDDRVRTVDSAQPLSRGDFVRLAYCSVAKRTVVPMQDVLGLGSGARMNTPGTVEGNWVWRMGGTELTPELAARLRRLAEIYGR